MKRSSANIPTILACVIAFIASVSLACQVSLGGPETEVSPVVTVAADEVIENIETLIQTGQAGEPITITLDETQVTSLLVDHLQSQIDPIIQEPQVILRDGSIEVYGKASRGLLSGNLHLTASAAVDEQGNPDLQITSADLGAVPLPDALLSAISTLIEEAFTTSIGSTVTGFQIESIVIQDGWLSITGRTH